VKFLTLFLIMIIFVHSFLFLNVSGGSKPNLADLAVYGVLRPIRYLRSGNDMVEHTRIGDWYTRMESAVGEPSRIKA
jgi:microsomal prostaglandin-E synthase 2